MSACPIVYGSSPVYGPNEKMGEITSIMHSNNNKSVSDGDIVTAHGSIKVVVGALSVAHGSGDVCHNTVNNTHCPDHYGSCTCDISASARSVSEAFIPTLISGLDTSNSNSSNSNIMCVLDSVTTSTPISLVPESGALSPEMDRDNSHTQSISREVPKIKQKEIEEGNEYSETAYLPLHDLFTQRELLAQARAQVLNPKRAVQIINRIFAPQKDRYTMRIVVGRESDRDDVEQCGVPSLSRSVCTSSPLPFSVKVTPTEAYMACIDPAFYALVQFYKGVCYGNLFQHEDAYLIAEDLITRVPGSCEGHYLKGIALHAMDFKSEALAMLQIALRRDRQQKGAERLLEAVEKLKSLLQAQELQRQKLSLLKHHIKHECYNNSNCPQCGGRFPFAPPQWLCPMCKRGEAKVAVALGTTPQPVPRPIKCPSTIPNSSNGGVSSPPYKLIYKRQTTSVRVWEPDDKNGICRMCMKPTIGIFSRHHHCRCCGHLVCGNCSTQRLPVPTLHFFSPVRVCTRCYNHLSEERTRKVSPIRLRRFTSEEIRCCDDPERILPQGNGEAPPMVTNNQTIVKSVNFPCTMDECYRLPIESLYILSTFMQSPYGCATSTTSNEVASKLVGRLLDCLGTDDIRALLLPYHDIFTEGLQLRGIWDSVALKGSGSRSVSWASGLAEAASWSGSTGSDSISELKLYHLISLCSPSYWRELRLFYGIGTSSANSSCSDESGEMKRDNISLRADHPQSSTKGGSTKNHHYKPHHNPDNSWDTYICPSGNTDGEVKTEEALLAQVLQQISEFPPTLFCE